MIDPIQKLHHEYLKKYMNSLNIGTFIYIFMTTYTYYIQPIKGFAGIASIAIVTNIIRQYLCWQGLKTGDETVSNKPFFRWLTYLSAIFVAVVPLIMITGGDIFSGAMGIMFLAGITAGAVSLYATDFPLGWRFIAISSLPTASYCVAFGNIQMQFIGAFIFMYCFGMISNLKRTSQTFKEGLLSLQEKQMEYEKNQQLLEVNASKQAELEMQREISQKNSRLASIGELAAGVGHEINNPLSIAYGFQKTLRRDLKKINPPGFPELDKKLEKMDQAYHRILNIVKNLRKFSRNEGDGEKFLDPISCLQESIDFVKDIYLGLDIKIVSKIDEKQNQYFILGNTTNIHQIYMNLLSNAKDAVELEQKKEIYIKAFQKDSQLFVEFGDSGPPIDDKITRQIFEPFFTTKSAKKGNGLGLFLTNKLVSDMHGQIQLGCKRPDHIKFILSFPLQEKTNALPGKAPEKKSSYDHALLGKRVLLVDNDPDLLTIYSEMLNSLGARVIIANNSTSAIESFQQAQHHHSPFDIVLADMSLPEPDGAQLLKKLSTLKSQKTRFILMTSGVYQDLSSPNSSVYGLIDGYLYKPFEEKELLQIIGQQQSIKAAS